MKKIALLFLIFGVFSCNKKQPLVFKSFYFSHNNSRANNSIKFTKSDTVYFAKYFPEKIGTYYTLISDDDKQVLNDFLKKLDFNKYDSIYKNEKFVYDNIFVFAVNKNSKSDWVVIHANRAPKELYDFGIWIQKFKQRHKFYITKKQISIEDLKSEDVIMY